MSTRPEARGLGGLDEKMLENRSKIDQKSAKNQPKSIKKQPKTPSSSMMDLKRLPGGPRERKYVIFGGSEGAKISKKN